MKRILIFALLVATLLMKGSWAQQAKPLTRGELPSVLQTTPARFFQTSVGTQLRQNVASAATTNEWAPDNPYILSCLPWQPDSYVQQGQVRVSGGNRYVATVSGATSAANPPTATDGTVHGETSNGNYATSSVIVSPPSAGGTGAAIGNQITFGTNTTVTLTSGIVLVANVSSGAVTRCSLVQLPVFTAATPGTLVQTATTGSGAGFQCVTTGSLTQVQWSYCGPNLVTSDPQITQVTWAGSMTATAATATSRETQCINGGNVYACTGGGTAASSGGPTGTGVAITDGSITWTFMGKYVTTPYANDFVSFNYTFGPTAPSGMTNQYAFGYAGAGALGAYSLTSGTSYAIGDTITITGGTETTNAVFKVQFNGLASVPTVTGAGSGYVTNDIIQAAGGTSDIPAAFSVTASGGHITGLTLLDSGRYTIPPTSFTQLSTTGVGAGFTGTVTTSQWGVAGPLAVVTPGSYTALPAVPASQGSSSGSGTGATLYVRWPDPFWCSLVGCWNAGTSASNTINPFVFQQTPNSIGIGSYWAVEFWTNAPEFYFSGLGAGGDPGYAVSENNHLVNFGELPNPNIAYSQQQYYTYTFTGSKPRLIRIEGRIAGGSTSGAIPAINVPSGYSCWAPDKTNYIPAVYIGDSMTEGSIYGPFLPNSAVAQQLGRLLGQQIYSVGIGGTGVTVGTATYGNNGTFGQRIYEASLLNPKVWYFEGSGNDLNSSGSAITAATLSCIQLVRKYSQAPVIWLGDMSVPHWSISLLSPAEAATQAAVASYMATGGSNCWFVPITNDTVPWITWSGDNDPTPSGLYLPNSLNSASYINTVDNTHPTDWGVLYEVSRRVRGILEYVYPFIP